MFKNVLDLKNDKLDNFLFFIFPLLFLVVKGWVNFIAVIFLLLSLFKIIINYRFFFCKRSKYFYTFSFLIILPFLSELIIQILRPGFYPSSIDGPSRFLIGFLLFVTISKKNDKLACVKSFTFGCVLSLLITFLYIVIIDDHYWGSRAATYFVDPNSLPVYSGLLCCFAVYYLQEKIQSNFYRIIFFLILFFAYSYIVHCSQTRTAWLPLIILFTFFLLSNYKFTIFLIFAILASLLIIILYLFNDIFNSRYDDIIYALNDMYNGTYDGSSLSIRTNIFLTVIEVIKLNPYLGIQDGFIPSFDILKSHALNLDQTSYYYLKNAGTHFEITAQLLRKGIFLGTITIMALFFMPAYYLWKFRKSHPPSFAFKGKMFFCATLMLLVSSFGIEVFNLKMYSTYWAIVLSLIYTHIYENFEASNSSNSEFD